MNKPLPPPSQFVLIGVFLPFDRLLLPILLVGPAALALAAVVLAK